MVFGGSNRSSCSEACITVRHWYSLCTSPASGPWDMVTCSDPTEQRFQSCSQGIPLPKLAQVGVTSEWANPGGLAGYQPHIRASPPSEQAASSGPEVQDSSGASTTCSSSGSGVGEEGAEEGVGATGSFPPHPTSPILGDNLLQGGVPGIPNCPVQL